MPGKAVSAIERILKQTISIFIIISFTLVCTYTIFADAVYSHLSNQETIQSILDINKFSERSRPAIADLIFSYSLNLDSYSNALRDLPMDTWEDVAEILFPAEWVDTTVDSLIKSAWAWLNDPADDVPKLLIDLSQPLGILRSRRGSLAVLPLLQSVPTCSADVTVLEIVVSKIPECLPQGIDMIQTSRILAGLFANLFLEKIDFEMLESQNMITKDTLRSVENIQTSYTAFGQSRRFGLLFSLFLLSVYCLLRSNQPIIMLRSLIIPLISTAILSLVLVAATWGFMQWGWQFMLTYSYSYLDASLLNLIADLGNSLSKVILKSWLLTPFILLLLSFGGGLILRALQTTGGEKFSKKHDPASNPRRTFRKQFR